MPLKSAPATEVTRERALLLDSVVSVPVVSVIGPEPDATRFAEWLEAAATIRFPHRRVIAARDGRAQTSSATTQITVGSTDGADIVITVAPGGEPTLYFRAGETSRLRNGDANTIEDRVPDRVRHRAVGPMEVAILGPTEFRGVDPILRGRPLLAELVVHLALHPEGASTRSWSSALWPDRLVPAQTISNRLSEARQLLGFAPDDRPRLRREGDRHLIVDLTTDWQRFQTLAAAPEDPDSWRDALALVRGRPLLDLAQGQWAVMEGIVSEIEHGVVECGLALGRAMLGTSDPDGAAWAAQMALRCAPWDERLHRLLMRAADAAGNRLGVESALRHLALVLEIDGDPLHAVHPQTAALYMRLASTPVEAPASTVR